MAESPLTPDAERELHRRLLENDPTAPSDLASAFLDALIEVTRLLSPRIDESLAVQAAEDAILALIKNPAAFRPGASLWGYLRMSARGDLKNALAKEQRRRKRSVPLEFVEQGASAGKYQSREGDAASLLVRTEDIDDIEKRIVPCAKRGLTEDESRALDLVLDGERRTAAFAAVLGIAARPASEQRAIVKRLKDKLKVRLKRCREEA